MSRIQHAIEMLKNAMVVVGAMATAVAFMFLTGNVWLPLLAIGVGFTAYGIYRLAHSNKVKSWAVYPGKVERVEVRRRPVFGQPYDYKEYFPFVRYSYSVSGAEYESETYSPVRGDFSSPNEETVKKELSGVSVGSSVSVYVNPNEPSDSYLKYEISQYRRSHYLAMIVGGVLVGVMSVCMGYFVAR